MRERAGYRGGKELAEERRAREGGGEEGEGLWGALVVSEPPDRAHNISIDAGKLIKRRQDMHLRHGHVRRTHVRHTQTQRAHTDTSGADI